MTLPRRLTVTTLFGTLLLAGCGPKKHDPAAEAPPASATVITAGDASLVHLDRPDQFPTVAAASYQATSTLNVTGQVQPDISREIPVISLANGRVVATHVRLGDYVRKGQLVLEVQSTDVTGAFAQYLKAQNDERLARVQLDRAKLLYSKGAIALSQVEIAQDADDDAATDLRAAEQQLHVLGVDPRHPGETVKVLAPASGFIIQQNVTDAAAAGNGAAGSPNAFVIADLSHVWILCDVYENDLASVHLGQSADIRLSAYPDRPISGTVGDVGAILDPNLRTGKVRVQVPNPGFFMRVGMFATATFHGKKQEMHTSVPSTAVLHLHDRDWVYEPVGNGQFQRVAVVSGDTLPGNLQEVTSGLAAGQQVVRNALELQNTVAQ
ncbi:efflux RND transporter periplasmic adaptor subunit [Acidipila sp. EB88]|nr:efflux RND transporter periplasmic adaptor subunit [Acidipila sp. EB88]